MNQRPTGWALAIGVACGGLAFFLLYQKSSEIQKRSTPVPVLMAVRYIAPGASVRPDWVEKKMVPEAFVSPSAISDLRPLEGLVSLAPISSGEQLLVNKFGKPGENLSWSLDPGFRAFTLSVDETKGVGGLLSPGDRVDLLYKGSAGGKEVTTFLYQDLRVLAVGNRTLSPDTALSSPTGYHHVTLSVTPTQAEELFFLEGRSQVRLVLRGRADESRVHLEAADDAALYRRIRGVSSEEEE
jgi:pilus assembly protein CpaB